MSKNEEIDVLFPSNNSKIAKESTINDPLDSMKEYLINTNQEEKSDPQPTNTLNVGENSYINSNIYKNNETNSDDNKGNILGNISNGELNNEPNSEQSNEINISLSKIEKVTSQCNDISESGLSFLSFDDLEDEKSFKFINDRINEGFIPFFAKLSGLKSYFIIAKKDTLFLDVIKGLKQHLNITNNLGNFYQNKHLINFYKTVGELNIKNLDYNITNYISEDE